MVVSKNLTCSSIAAEMVALYRRIFRLYYETTLVFDTADWVVCAPDDRDGDFDLIHILERGSGRMSPFRYVARDATFRQNEGEST